MFTYFVKNNVNSLVKIGKASDVQRRLKQITGSCSFLKLELLHSIEGDYEAHFHGLYASFRKEGEWFDLPDISLDKIEADLRCILKSLKKSTPATLPHKNILHALVDALTLEFSPRSLKSVMELYNPEDNWSGFLEWSGDSMESIFYETKQQALFFDTKVAIIFCKNLYGDYDEILTIHCGSKYKTMLLSDSRQDDFFSHANIISEPEADYKIENK